MTAKHPIHNLHLSTPVQRAVDDGEGPSLKDFLPDTSKGYIAKAGEPLAEPGGPANAVAVEDALKSVHDPLKMGM